MFAEVRTALRSLSKRPLFSIAVITTLALGIGSNAAIFSLVDALILRPFPIPQIDRLVMLWETIPEKGADRIEVSPANFLDWQAQNSSFEHLVASSWWSVNLTGNGPPERLQGTRITPGFLRILGVQPVIGTTLREDSTDPADQKTVVLSYAFWMRRFGGDRGILGQPIRLGREAYQVVGVAAPDFSYPNGSDVWAPLVFTPESAGERANHYLSVIGRLKEGVAFEEARSEMAALARRLEQEYRSTNQGWGVQAMELKRAVVDVGLPSFLTLWQAATVFVLLIACVNVGNLLLARGSDRKKELSIRLALGAGRFRVIRQLMLENLFLSLAGGAVSIPAAWLGVTLIRDGLPPRIQRFVVGWSQLGVDLTTVAFTIGLAIAAVVLFGIVPAWMTTRINLAASIHDGGRGSDGAVRQRGRTALVVAEVAIALMLLIASGLSIQGTLRTINQDQGYDPDGLMTMRVSLPESYREAQKQRAFFKAWVEELRRLPGVEGADVVNVIPSSGSNTSKSVQLPGQENLTRSELPYADFRIVSSTYFETMGIPLVAGRNFDSRDVEDGLPVVLVSEKLARQLWPSADPVGKRFRTSLEEEGGWLTVVGVVGDVWQDWFLGAPSATFYRPLSQEVRESLAVVFRTQNAPSQVVKPAQTVLHRIDPDVPLFDVMTMRQMLSDRMVGLRYAASVMGVFGLIALLLAGVGVYGLLAYSVGRRTREFGIRMALGAGDRDILRVTVVRTLRHCGLGFLIGLGLAFAAGRLMESALFGTISVELSVFLLFTLVLALVAVIAAYVPARRALRLDPSQALRLE